MTVTVGPSPLRSEKLSTEPVLSISSVAGAVVVVGVAVVVDMSSLSSSTSISSSVHSVFQQLGDTYDQPSPVNK